MSFNITKKFFLIPDDIPEDLLNWYTYNLEVLSAEQLYFFRHIFAIKQGFKSREDWFLVSNTNLDLQSFGSINLYDKNINYDLIWIQQDSDVQDQQIRNAEKTRSTDLYYITRKYADIILQNLDKPFTYLTLFDYNLNILNNFGKTGFFRLDLSKIKTPTQTQLIKTVQTVKAGKFSLCFVSNSNTRTDLKNFFQKTLLPNQNFYLTDSLDADYIFAVNKVPEDSKVHCRKVILAQMEPNVRMNGWREQFDSWYDDNPTQFCYYLRHEYSLNNLEWHLQKTVKELKEPIQKTRADVISSVMSSQYFMDGHKLRIDFLKYLEANTDVKLDIYGKTNHRNFKNYRGSLPSWNKNQGLLEYKYTFHAENCGNKNYCTEKLIDAICAETLCFYSGAPNISDIIDSRAYILLDLRDKEASAKRVLEAIQNNEYMHRIEYIRKEKEKILTRLQVAPRIEGLIKIDQAIKFILISEEDRNNREKLENFHQMARQQGFFHYQFSAEFDFDKDESKAWKIAFDRKKDLLVLHLETELLDGFIDQLTFLLNRNTSASVKSFLNLEAGLNLPKHEIIDTVNLDLTKILLSKFLCYYVSFDQLGPMLGFRDIYESIKKKNNWKLTTRKICK